jgi:hypothetical protein
MFICCDLTVNTNSMQSYKRVNMIDKLRVGSDMEGSSCGEIVVLFWNLSGGTGEKHEINQDIWCSVRDSNRVAPEHESRI